MNQKNDSLDFQALQTSTRRPYVQPTLVEYGDINTVTRDADPLASIVVILPGTTVTLGL